MNKKVFTGIGGFLDAVCDPLPDGPMIRGRCASCEILQEVGNLVGQAYERPDHASAIIAAAADRARILALRSEAATAVLEQARADLVPTVAKPPTPTPAPSQAPTKRS